MTLERVAELVRRAAGDTGIVHALKTDPQRLGMMLNLSATDVDALLSASAFPIPALERPALQPIASDVATEGATLLPPEGSGEFTGTPLTALTGAVPPGTPTPPPIGPPAGPPTTPPLASPRPPAPPPSQPPSVIRPPSPIQPPRPPTTPPQVPPRNGAVTPPTVDHPIAPQAEPSPPAAAIAAPACGCACCAALATLALVSTTALTAIAAIAAGAGEETPTG